MGWLAAGDSANHLSTRRFYAKLRARRYNRSGLKLTISQGSHVGQMAVFIVVIEAVADDENVGDAETVICRSDGNPLPPLLPEKHRRPEAGRLHLRECLEKPLERLAG